MKEKLLDMLADYVLENSEITEDKKSYLHEAIEFAKSEHKCSELVYLMKSVFTTLKYRKLKIWLLRVPIIRKHKIHRVPILMNHKVKTLI